MSATSSNRLESLDTLRGLDMLIILGLDLLLIALAALFPESGALKESAVQMGHEAWQGLRVYDLIFPVFVFIAGVSMSFSLKKFTGENAPVGKGLLKVWRRAAVLTLLGMLVNGALTWTDGMRYASVLGLIGCSCALAGTGVLLLRRTSCITVLTAVLTGIVALIQFTGGDFTPTGSVNAWIDQHYLPGRLHDGAFDPEGLLCIVSATALCLMGRLTGEYLQSSGSGIKKGLILLGIGILLLAAALGLDHVYPIIKKIWTGSFVLASAGVGMISLAIFYLIIDVWNLRKWTFPLRLFGFNALVAYLFFNVLNLPALNHRIFCGVAELCGAWEHVCLAGTLILLQGGILYIFYRNKIFIKI